MNATQLHEDSFPILAAQVRIEKYLQPLLGTLKNAITQHQINNPTFIDAKRKLNYIIEEVFRMQLTNEDFVRFTYTMELDYSQGNHIKGKIAKAEKMTRTLSSPDLTAFLAVSKELLTLHETLEGLKAVVIKRKQRTEEEMADDYRKPLPDQGVMAGVTTVLRKMTDPLAKTFAENLLEQFVRRVNCEIENPKKRGDKKQLDPLMSMVGENWDSWNGNYGSLRPDYAKILKDHEIGRAHV